MKVDREIGLSLRDDSTLPVLAIIIVSIESLLGIYKSFSLFPCEISFLFIFKFVNEGCEKRTTRFDRT